MGLSPERARKRKRHGNSSDPPTVPEGELGVTAVTNGHGQPSRDKGRTSEADFPPPKKKRGKKGREEALLAAGVDFGDASFLFSHRRAPGAATCSRQGFWPPVIPPPRSNGLRFSCMGSISPPPRGPRLAQDSLPHTPSCLCTPLGSASPPVLLFSCSAKP